MGRAYILTGGTVAVAGVVTGKLYALWVGQGVLIKSVPCLSYAWLFKLMICRAHRFSSPFEGVKGVIQINQEGKEGDNRGGGAERAHKTFVNLKMEAFT